MKTGCQSRMLLNDFTNHKAVYDYYILCKNNRKIQKIYLSFVWKVRIAI